MQRGQKVVFDTGPIPPSARDGIDYFIVERCFNVGKPAVTMLEIREPGGFLRPFHFSGTKIVPRSAMRKWREPGWWGD